MKIVYVAEVVPPHRSILRRYKVVGEKGENYMLCNFDATSVDIGMMALTPKTKCFESYKEAYEAWEKENGGES